MILPTTSLGDLTDAGRAAPGGHRLLLTGTRLERGPAGLSRVVVEFAQGVGGERLVSTQEGTACPGGDLRMAALATFAVLTDAVEGIMRFELIGVKPVRAFDSTVMMVAANVRFDGQVTRVVGAAVLERSEIEAAVRATLHAVNRLVSPLLGPLPINE
jgi:hypothetical protein